MGDGKLEGERVNKSRVGVSKANTLRNPWVTFNEKTRT